MTAGLRSSSRPSMTVRTRARAVPPATGRSPALFPKVEFADDRRLYGSTRCTAALVAGNTSGAVTHQFSFLAGRGRRLDVLSGCRTCSGGASSPISLVAATAAQEMRRREPDVEAGTG
jgi:hypothetical protein